MNWLRPGDQPSADEKRASRMTWDEFCEIRKSDKDLARHLWDDWGRIIASNTLLIEHPELLPDEDEDYDDEHVAAIKRWGFDSLEEAEAYINSRYPQDTAD